MATTYYFLLLIGMAFTITLPTERWTSAPELGEESSLIVGDTFVEVNWKQAKNTGFHFSTELSYSKLNPSNYAADTKIKMYPYQTENITRIFSGQNWNLWTSITLGEVTMYRLNDLIPKDVNILDSIYKLRVRMTSPYGNSEWSSYKVILTKPLLEKYRNEHVRLVVRGTGGNNHNNSVIKLNNFELLNRGDFIGLYLLVLDRTNLRKVFGGVYDTQSSAGTYSETINYTTTIINSDNSVAQNWEYQSFTYEKSWQASNDLAKKIASYDEGYFVILVSCVAWERYLTEALVKVLVNCGASNILEYYNEYRKVFSNETATTNFATNATQYTSIFRHPYAFVGIPNIGPGNGFESLRSNIGYYLAAGKFPYAELWIRLAYNPYMGLYTFHTVQETPQFRYSDPIEKIKNATDFTLRNVYEELVDSNKTFRDNWLFVIYRNKDYSKPLYDTSQSRKQTEMDKVYFGMNAHSARYDKQGIKYLDGLDPTQVPYYKFVESFLNGSSCPPPYNDYTLTSCMDLSKVEERPFVIQCYVGIQPQNCPELPKIEQDFEGFN